MKTALHLSTRGNTLMVTIVMTAIVGFLLTAYLSLVQNQNTANARSQVWNSAMPIVEAGIEDALSHLNKHGTTNLNCDGWTQTGSDYTVTRSIDDGVYSVKISNFNPTNGAPVIESCGYVVAPLLVSSDYPLLASVNVSAPTLTYIGRGVRVQTRRDYIFAKGMVAKDSIDLNGNNIRADSFDSLDPLHSTNGMYSPLLFKANGDIAVNSSLTNSLNTGNAQIYGHLSTGPDGTVAIGVQGTVGSVEWHDAGSTGVQPGWTADDMNVSFPDVEPPWSGGAATPNGGWVTNVVVSYSTNSSTVTTVTFPLVPSLVITNYQTGSIIPALATGPITTNYLASGAVKNYTWPIFSYQNATVVTNSSVSSTYYDILIQAPGNYQISQLSGTVYVSADVTLFVTESLNMTALTIKPPNGNLTLYSKASSVTLPGNKAANAVGNAMNFSFWGLPEVKQIAFSGNGTFTGTIYAPNAEFTLNGGGKDVIDFIGASITRTAVLNGHFNFHYDEALRNIGPFRGFIVTAWAEMPPSSVPLYTK